MRKSLIIACFIILLTSAICSSQVITDKYIRICSTCQPRFWHQFEVDSTRVYICTPKQFERYNIGDIAPVDSLAYYGKVSKDRNFPIYIEKKPLYNNKK